MYRRFTIIAAVIGSVIVGGAPAVRAEDPLCTVEGFVRSTAGTPIAGADVIVEQLGIVVATEQDGRYCVPELEPGTYHLLVSAGGFHQRHSHPIRVNGQPTQVDIVLTPKFQSEVVVTGTRTEKRLEDVPVRTEVVDRETIEQVEARTLADAVEYTTGVRVENNCQNCNFSQIRLLGLQGEYTQLLIDSMPLVSSLAQVYGVEQIPARMIDRIEVVKGGGSAIYGSGSVGGVVNVIPHEPVRSGGEVELRYDLTNSDPRVNAVLDWVALDNETAVTLFGQTDTVSPIDVDGDGYTEVGRRDFTALGVRGHQYLLGGNARLTLDYAHMKEDRRGGDNLHLPELMANIAESVQSDRNVASLGWVHTVGSACDYSVSVAYADTERDTYYGAGMDPNAYGRTENPLTIVDTQFNHTLGDHVLSWGVQYSNDELRDSQPAYDRFLDESYRNVGLFVQDDWVVGGGWELVLGARVDDYSEIDDVIASPRVAAVWSPTPTVDLRGSIAAGFRGPQVFDEDLHITQVGGEGQVIRNAPTLEEESSTSYVLDLSWNPPVADGVGLFEVTLFRTEIDNLFEVDVADDPLTDEIELVRSNASGATVEGIELNVGYAVPDVLKLEVGYVAKSSTADEPEGDFGSTDLFRTPEDYGVFSVSWTPNDDLSLWLGARYTGQMKVPHYAGYIDKDRLETSEKFLTLDWRLAKRFTLTTEPTTSCTVSVGGKNITDEYQDDLDRGSGRDAGYVYGPRFPRSYYLSLTVNF